MKYMVNLRLPVKLYASASIILGLVVVMAGSSWSAFREIDQAFLSVRSAVEISTLAQTAQVQMAGAGYGNLGVSRVQTPEDLTRYETASITMRDASAKTLSKALSSATDTQDHALLQTMQDKVKGYDRISGDGLSLRRDYMNKLKDLYAIAPKLGAAVDRALD